MYERFTADPSSVDPSWSEYFATHGAPGTANGSGAGSGGAAREQRDVAATPGGSSGDGAPATDPSSDRPRTTSQVTPDQPRPPSNGSAASNRSGTANGSGSANGSGRTNGASTPAPAQAPAKAAAQ